LHRNSLNRVIIVKSIKRKTKDYYSAMPEKQINRATPPNIIDFRGIFTEPYNEQR